MARRTLLLTVLAALLAAPVARAVELPWWLDSVDVTYPVPGGYGAVTLSGTWIDTGAPDSVTHSILDGALHFTVAAPDLNVITGDALTPWTLTEEFGPLSLLPSGEPVNGITGSIWSVDPANRNNRVLYGGPDPLGWLIPPPRGEFHGLGTGEAYVSAAYDVSADGRVVVGADELAPNAAGFITSEAFAWTPSTGKVSIGILPGGIPGGSTAYGVSAEGNHVVGGSSSGAEASRPYEAFRWSLGGGMEGLGAINQFSSISEARATSRNGAVVVGTDEFFPPVAGPNGPIGVRLRRAFRYTDDGGMQDLGVLDEYGFGSTTEAADVSANGRVVVGTAVRDLYAETDAVFPDLAQPFRWNPETGMEGLGNLPRFFPAIFPNPQQETIANAVSADGRVVVGVDRVQWPPFADGVFPYREESAVLWSREEGWIDLGRFELAPGPLFSAAEAVDVSADGDTVVGNAKFAYLDALGPAGSDVQFLEGPTDDVGRSSVPFIWDRRRGMRPLARVLAGDFGLDFDGWRLGEATAISDDGTTIVGTGVNPDGVQEAWRAVLRRNTRPGDADFDGDVDQYDRATLDRNLGMTSAGGEVYYDYGDFNSDGVVGPADLELLLANYDHRVLGDFNADGVVDAADYSLWRDRKGSETAIADSNGDGLVNAADLAAWRANYGLSVDDPRAVAVPEPAAAGLLLLGALAATAKRR